jgi:hypothetical protein
MPLVSPNLAVECAMTDRSSVLTHSLSKDERWLLPNNGGDHTQRGDLRQPDEPVFSVMSVQRCDSADSSHEATLMFNQTTWLQRSLP